MDSKQCRMCHKIKVLNDFYKQNKKKADGEHYIYYNPECKECTKKRAIKWQEDNYDEYRRWFTERNKKFGNEYYKDIKRKWTSENREHINDYKREWNSNNKDKLNKYTKYRNMHKKHDISDSEWETCKRYFYYTCAYCDLSIEDHYRIWEGKPKKIDFHKEHVQHNGSNDISNCIPSCQSCNSSKWEYSLEEWYNKNNPNFSVERLDNILTWLYEDHKLLINN